MNRNHYSAISELHQYGWDVAKHSSVKPNHGSETTQHLLAKTLVCKACIDAGYRTDTEVQHDATGKQIDVLAWGHPSRLTYAIECETNPTDEAIRRKAEQYVGGPVDDLLVVNVSEMPEDCVAAQQYIRDVLGGL